MYPMFLRLWMIVICCSIPGTLAAQELPFGIALPPSLNFAVSPSPVGSGARAAGKAFAFIGVADDATAASHNPGGLVQLQRPEATIVGSYFIQLERLDVNRRDTLVQEQSLDSANLNYLSVVYPFRLFRFNVVASLNFQRLFDLQGDTKVTSRFTSVEGIQKVRSRQDGQLFAISPALAVEITRRFSIGVAFNIWPDIFGNGWEQEVSVAGQGRVASGNRTVPFVSTGRIKEKYAFKGFNLTVGFLWEINPIWTLGGVFRSPFTAKVKRTHTSSITVTLQDGSASDTSQLSFSETLDMDMPLSYGLGLAVRPFPHRFQRLFIISLDVVRTHWSDFRLEKSTRDNALLVENGAPSGKGEAVLNSQGDDTTSVRLGAEYVLIRRNKISIPLRAGFFYDPEPSERGTDDFFGFSLGTGIGTVTNRVSQVFSQQLILDIAYTFRTGNAQSETTDTTVYQHTILASVIYHF